MLAWLADVAPQAGDADGVARLAAEAEALARTITDPDVVTDVRDMFLTVLVPDGSAEQLAGDD